MFIPVVSYLYLSKKIFNTFCSIFIVFVETEDALVKWIFLITKNVEADFITVYY